jgi:hypothetical protein
MLINYYYNGNELIELREPVAAWHIRFLKLFDLMNNSRDDTAKYQACLGLLSRMLVDASIVDSIINPDEMTINFVNEVLGLFANPEMPDLSVLTDLLEDSTSTDYIQNSGDFEGHWLSALFQLFEGQALNIWKTQSLSTIQAMLFEARQSLILNAVKDKLTPDGLKNHEIKKQMQSLIKDGKAFGWVQDQMYPTMTDELLELVETELDGLKLD